MLTRPRIQIGIIALEVLVLAALLPSMLSSPCSRAQAPFFCGHYDASVPLLWTPGHEGMSDQAWDYWIRLDLNFSDRQLRNQSMEGFALIQKLLPSQPPIAHHASCAVVGNSGNLIHSGYGADIDSHEAIFRMTVAPTRGYEKDVGTKTTYHLIYSSILYKEYGIDPKAIILYYSGSIGDLQVFTDFLGWRALYRKTMKPTYALDYVPLDHYRMLHPEFWSYVQYQWLRGVGSHPSTGIMAIVLALHVCDKVDVYGFGRDNNGNWDHYYEKEHIALKTDMVHNFDVEATIRHQLNEEHSITDHRGVR